MDDMSSPIKFGTSGWRAIIAEDFTLANVKKAVEAIARYVTSTNPARPSRSGGPSLIVGYDTRFLSEKFAAMSAELLASHGIHCYLSQQAVPTPAIACAIRRLKTDGAINFTASHNPAHYNGVKFSTPDGAPAMTGVTQKVEAWLDNDSPPQLPEKPAAVESVDLQPAYLEEIAQKVNLDLIRSAGLRLAYDPLYGTGIGYIDGLLAQAGIEAVSVHNWRDVLFGGHPPEPDGEHLGELRQAMQQSRAHLGLATDGDADRFGIVDESGTFISPNHILALLLDYLIESRRWTAEEGWTGGAAKSVATTHLIDAVAKFHRIAVYETPVGFKHIGEMIQQDKLVLGGEESAGLTIRHHVPEKDGILACLLTAEMVASRGMPLDRQIQELFGKVGSYYPGRWSVPLTETLKKRFVERSKQEYSDFQGRRVVKTVRMDGLKLLLDDGSWVLFRLSGTEPVCRLYCEASTEKGLEELAATARRFLFD
ncbi:MAG: phosphoglucomutase/phosphomannomutase family protein [Acidobacteriota bacterium]